MHNTVANTITFAGWLRAFLDQRRLEVPDQRPLYAYHCSHEAYAHLHDLFRRPGACRNLGGNTAAAACFVLFCAEWYRREYQRLDGWAWEPIFATLGVRLSAQELAKTVPRGLAGYWKRPLHFYESSRRDFLGSVFVEGGLPSQLLRKSDSRFQRLFDRLLRGYDAAHLLGFSTFQQVERLLARTNFAKVFASADSTALIAEMADRLIALVRDYALDQASDPIVKINALNPKWRELFPLPLDDATGSQLLVGLLKTATDEGGKRRKRIGAWKCVHFWDEHEPDVLTARVTLPNEVELELNGRPSATRFELAVTEDGQVIAKLGAGYAEIVGEGRRARIRLRTVEVAVKRRRVSVPLNLIALLGGATVASVSIPASTVALGEAPVGFEPDADRWQLCGQASFNAAGTELLLALPPDADLTTGEQQDEIQISDGPNVCKLRTVQVHGKGELRVVAGDFYRIRTGRAQQSETGLELSGRSTGWPTLPSLTFVGLPKPQLPGGGDVLQEGIALYVGNRRTFGGLPQETLGTQFVSLRNSAGDTLLRRKIGVLPSDFRIELEGGATPACGYVKVHTHTPCLVQACTPGVHSRQARQEECLQLTLEATAAPPATVRIAVTPNLEADPVLIDLPFPSSGCLAFDRDGKPLSRELCIDDLPGSRLILFGAAATVTHFTLELTLKGMAARNMYYRWPYTVRGNPLSIELYSLHDQIVDLLSLQPEVDQVVELRVSDNRRDTYFRIDRYAARLQYDSTHQRVMGTEPSHDSAGAPEPWLMLLHDPKQKSIPLEPCTSEGVPTGEFAVPQQSGTDGPWLVLPGPQSPISFRPLYIPGNTPKALLEGETHSLEKASARFDPVAAPDAFAPVLSEMADNPHHSGWAFLNALYESYGHLPLPTFKVWGALVLAAPRTLAAALLKFDADPRMVGRIEREFPILWEFFPLPVLRDATQLFRRFLQAGGIDDSEARGIVTRVLDRLAESIPIYDETARRFLIGDPVVNPVAGVPATVILEPWHQALLRDRGDAEWPTYMGERLEEWASDRMRTSLPFPIQADFRRTVIFLPLFAAAVAAGNAEMTDVFPSDAASVFALRQVRDFDFAWFNSMYQYYLSQALAAPEGQGARCTTTLPH